MSLKLLFTEQELSHLKDPQNDNKTVYVQFGRDESKYYYITSIKDGSIYGFISDEGFGIIPEFELLTRSSFKHQKFKPFPLTKITNEIKFNNFLLGATQAYSDIKQKIENRNTENDKSEIELSDEDTAKAEARTNEDILKELRSLENNENENDLSR